MLTKNGHKIEFLGRGPNINSPDTISCRISVKIDGIEAHGTYKLIHGAFVYHTSPHSQTIKDVVKRSHIRINFDNKGIRKHPHYQELRKAIEEVVEEALRGGVY